MSKKARDSTQDPKIFKAAERNDLEAIKQDIEVDQTPADSVNWIGETVAHIGVKNGNIDIVKYILEKNPLISTVGDLFGNTVLSLAVENGRLEIVKYLVEHHKADIFKPFKRFFGHPTAVHLAARSGQLPILKYFIEEKQADVNAINVFREPLVFSAARRQHRDIVKYLFEERNADLTATDVNGDNILYTSIKENDLNLMKYVLDEKKIPLDVNGKNKYGRALLHLAAFFNNVGILSYLVEEKHADVNPCDTKGQTPLHRAAFFNHTSACEYLIEHGANIQQKDQNGVTPLQITSDQNLTEYMEKALQKRNRRSVNLPTSSLWWTDVEGNSHNVEAISTKSICWFAGRSTESLAKIPFLLSFFVISKLLVGEKHGPNQIISSPQETVESRVDSVAINAIQSPPNLKNIESI